MTVQKTPRSQAVDLIGLENVRLLEDNGLMIVSEQEWVRRVLVEEVEA